MEGPESVHIRESLSCQEIAGLANSLFIVRYIITYIIWINKGLSLIKHEKRIKQWQGATAVWFVTHARRSILTMTSALRKE